MIDEATISKLKSVFLIMVLICSGLFFILPLTPEIQIASASAWTQTTDTEFYNGSFENIMVNGTGASAKLQVVPMGQSLWTNKTRIGVSSPGPTWGHDMAPIYGTDKVLLFGGTNETDDLNETWIYDYGDNTWTKRTYSTGPSARFHHGMAPVYNEAKVVLFGGNSGSTYFNDTWIYDYNTDSWTQNKSQPLPPFDIHRYRPASHRSDDKIALFSGGPLNDDTYVYDVSSDTWKKLSTTTNPSDRIYHRMATVDGTDKAVLFSGLIGMNTNDTWVFDFGDENWTEKSPATTPLSRFNYGMAPIFGTSKIMIFGGLAWPTHFDDAWIYDISQGAEGSWFNVTPQAPAIKPGPRENGIMVPIFGTNSILLFGGRYYDGVTTYYLNDTWVYSHGSTMANGTYTSMAYNTTSKSDFKTLSWSAETPADTTIRLQLRTGANESDIYTKPFVGPDGTAATYYTLSPSPIWSGHDNGIFIQYKTYFNTTNPSRTPALKDITITYNCLPTLEVLSPANESILADNKPTFNWNFSDSDSPEQKAFEVLIDDDINFGSVNFNSGQQSTGKESWKFPLGTTYSTIPDGTWYWTVRTKDADEQWTEYSAPFKFQIDSQPPSSMLVQPINDGYYSRLDYIIGTASDPASGSGLNKIKVQIKSLGTNQYWNGSDWITAECWLIGDGNINWIYNTTAIPWQSELSYSVQSQAIDNASNIEADSTKVIFMIDKESPNSTIFEPNNDVWLNSLESISGSCLDIGGSGIDTIEICITCVTEYRCWDDTQWGTQETWLVVTGDSQWQYNSSSISWITGYQYEIKSRGIDKAENIEIPMNDTTFYYDSEPPQNLGILINNDQEYTTSTSVTLAVSAEDTASGISKVSFSTDGSQWLDWEPFNIIRYLDLPVGDGEKSVYFNAQDNTGNIAEPVFDTIILDTTPPQNLSIVINGNAQYSTSEEVTIGLSAKDVTSGLSEMSFSTNLITWTPWEPYMVSKAMTFSTSDGEKVVYFMVKDIVGNIAEPVFDSIIVDTTPPHALSISINSGATDTNSTEVHLSLSASDDTSGLDQVSFSTDGNTWSSWEPFTTEKSFTLPPNDGKKIVYFKVKDRAGNIAAPVSALIILNTTTPQDQTGPSTDSTSSSADEYAWMLYSIIAIVIVLIILLIGFLAIKRKKAKDQRVVDESAVTTIKPGQFTPSEPIPAQETGAPEISSQPQPQVAGAIPSEQPQLVPTVEPEQPQLAPQPEAVPALASPAAQASAEAPQAMPEAIQIPRLPPATEPSEAQPTAPSAVPEEPVVPSTKPEPEPEVRLPETDESKPAEENSDPNKQVQSQQSDEQQ